jgi:hypothetical protein
MFTFLLAAGFAQAQGTFVVPNAQANTEGNSSTSDPFTSSSFRFQQLYTASQFGAGGVVTELAFRIDGGNTNSVTMFFGNSTLVLSTTTRAADSLSPIFGDNLGGDAMTVRTGPASFGGLVPAPGTTATFDAIFSFQNGFTYNPAQGNLLIDLRGVTGQAFLPGAMDAQSATGDAVSWVYALNNLASSGTPSTLGLVTRFQVFSVPEPTTWILTLLGLAVCLIFRKRE